MKIEFAECLSFFLVNQSVHNEELANTMAADALGMQGARALVVVILLRSFQFVVCWFWEVWIDTFD